MKKNLLYLAFIAFALVPSCGKQEIFVDDSNDNMKVHLVGVTSKAQLSHSTKAAGAYEGIIDPTTDFGEDLQLSFIRIDRSVDDMKNNIGSPDFGLTFAENIPSSPSESDYHAAPTYYSLTGSLAASSSTGYREIRDFSTEQYFKNPDNAVQYVGWYPAGTKVSGTGKYTIKEDIDLKTDVIYSQIATETLDKEYKDTLVFKHALTQFRIYVYRLNKLNPDGTESADEVDGWGNLTEITLKGMPRSMTLELPANITYSSSDKADFNLSSLPATDATGIYFTPNVKIPAGVDRKQKVACFLAAPTDLSISVTAGTTASKALSIANEFKAGCAYDIVLAFSDHNLINADISLGDWQNGGQYETDVNAVMYYDLSRYGTANCYMVTSANTGYTFRADVKGCGNDLGGGDFVGVSDCSIRDANYLDVIYCEPEGLIELQGHQIMDGSAIFNVPGDPDNDKSTKVINKGNAIIGVYDRKDGNLLWSWHIWVTDPVLSQGYDNGYTFQDRNLGATEIADDKTSAANMIDKKLDKVTGFFYQWGRKDPMIPGFTKVSTSQVTIDQANAAGPSKYFGGGHKTWRNDISDADMGYSWGYKQNSNIVKTIYDPCPPGYRMPEIMAWTKVKNGKDLNYYVQAEDTTYIKNNTTPPNLSGSYIIGGQYIWYPGTGFIDHNQNTENALITIGHGDKGMDNNVYSNQWGYAFDSGYSKGAAKYGNVIAFTEAGNNVDACPVRCVSVNVEEVISDLSKRQTANCYIVPMAGNYKFKADIKGNGTNMVSVDGVPVSVYDEGVHISHNDIKFYTVLWWQGDLSGAKNNNTAGTNCPIKFVNDGKTLPQSPARTPGSGFTDEDITVCDAQGYIQFKIDEANYGYGNAIIAAIGHSNEILWTWHIWLTSQPQKVKLGARNVPTDYDVTTSGTWPNQTETFNWKDYHDHAYYIMDRNLGATYSPTSLSELNDNRRLASYGFYYQWGRKDPFPGPSAADSNTGTNSSTWYLRNTSGDFGWQRRTALNTSGQLTSRELAAMSPTTFCNNNASLIFRKDVQYTNWYSTNWSANNVDASQYLSQWGYSTSETTSLYNPRMTKTINDPCPEGYYIPHHFVFAAGGFEQCGNIHASENLFDGGDKDKKLATWPDKYSDSRGLLATNGDNFNISNPIWIPYAGYRSGSNGNFTSFTGDSKSAVFYTGVDVNATNRRLFTSSAIRSSWITATGGGQKFMYPADGVPVRCRAY